MADKIDLGDYIKPPEVSVKAGIDQDALLRAAATLSFFIIFTAIVIMALSKLKK